MKLERISSDGDGGGIESLEVIDSHTGGEPTRVVIRGGPDLGKGSLAERLELLRTKHDALRRSIILEPRGSDVLVGALLLPPTDPSCVAGVIFFDNVTYIGMCGHGTIGVVTTLAWMGKIQVGRHQIETPVGVVSVELHPDGSVSVTNVPSYREAKAKTFRLDDGRLIVGDIAWGGNWFFLTENYPGPIERAAIDRLTDDAWRMRMAVNQQGYPAVDHIVLLGPSPHHDVDVRDFVLCPGKAYDRSPCGTGTSAWLACLAADGRLPEGVTWIQESVIGSRFVGVYRWHDAERARIIPTITGHAYVTAKSTLLFDPRDPFRLGITE